MSEQNVTRDPNFDINSLLKSATDVPKEDVKKELSPLEKMVSNEKEKGMIVSNADMAAGEEGPKRSHVDNDERLEAYDKELEDYDTETEKLKYLIQKKTVNDAMEHAELIDELSDYTVDGLKKLQELHPDGATLKGKYFNLAPLNSVKKEVDVANAKNTSPKTNNTEKDPVEEEFISAEEAAEMDDEEKEHQRIVKVLIDKTNLGVPAIFDEVEKDAIFNADQIDLVEVETVELSSLKMNKPQKSFMESVEEYEAVGSQIPMIFPCSRFRATINGLSNGEMGDIALTVNNTDYESENKKLSIIYNKMKNCSFGQFDNYEDFLENFAYVDVPMAIYALYIATSPEEDHIVLRCGNDDCKKSFNNQFRSRSLLRLDRCTDAFLHNMDIVSDANIKDSKKLFIDAPHRKQKLIKLPNSKWIVSLAYINCREYLDIFANNDSLEKFLKEYPDDKNGVRFLGMQFIHMVRSIATPNADGSYNNYTDTKDIIDAMYYMNTDDFQVLNTVLEKYMNDYTPVFGIEGVKCPHCGTESDFVEVDIKDLVFRAYRRNLSTTVNLKKLEDL